MNKKMMENMILMKKIQKKLLDLLPRIKIKFKVTNNIRFLKMLPIYSKAA